MPHIVEETVDCIRGELSSLDYRNIDKAKVEAIEEKIAPLCVDEYEEATGGDPSAFVSSAFVFNQGTAAEQMSYKLGMLKSKSTSPEDAKLNQKWYNNVYLINDLLDLLE